MSVLPTQEAIEARWATFHDRGGHDYTGEGCRVLAEHAFTDIPFLLGRVRELEDALRAIAPIVDAIFADGEPDLPPEAIDAFTAVAVIVSAALAVSPERTSGPEGDTT